MTAPRTPNTPDKASGGYFRIEDRLIDHGVPALVGPHAWTILSALLRHRDDQNKARVSLDRLMLITGMSAPTLRKHTDVLKAKGVIRFQLIGRCYTYEFLPVEGYLPAARISADDVTRARRERKGLLPEQPTPQGETIFPPSPLEGGSGVSPFVTPGGNGASPFPATEPPAFSPFAAGSEGKDLYPTDGETSLPPEPSKGKDALPFAGETAFPPEPQRGNGAAPSGPQRGKPLSTKVGNTSNSSLSHLTRVSPEGEGFTPDGQTEQALRSRVLGMEQQIRDADLNDAWVTWIRINKLTTDGKVSVLEAWLGWIKAGLSAELREAVKTISANGSSVSLPFTLLQKNMEKAQSDALIRRSIDERRAGENRPERRRYTPGMRLKAPDGTVVTVLAADLNSVETDEGVLFRAELNQYTLLEDQER